jgi:hypothetical protein
LGLRPDLALEEDFLNDLKKSIVFWLLFSVAVVLVYGFLDPEKTAFPQCPFRSLTGLLCPGCGSQRAIHHVLHGNFGEAMEVNALFLPAVLYGLAYLALRFVFPKSWPAIRTKFFGLNAAYISLGIILFFAFIRNVL